jgi:energy-converting hydrogenase Eha subunit A
MKIGNNLLLLIIISSRFIFLTGCFPQTNYVLTNEDSIRKLNDMVKERTIRVTATDSVYSGDNIIIKHDTTVVEKYSTIPNTIPSSSMKYLSYVYGSESLDGIIILKNARQIKAKNINLPKNDSTIRFDEIITTSTSFPTDKLVKIQRREHTAAAFNGIGYGILFGAAAGTVAGMFVGHVDDVPDNTGRPDGSGQGYSRIELMGWGAITGAIIGIIPGVITSSVIGQWEDIDITYQYEKKTP